jgi:hypothetical protein
MVNARDQDYGDGGSISNYEEGWLDTERHVNFVMHGGHCQTRTWEANASHIAAKPVSIGVVGGRVKHLSQLLCNSRALKVSADQLSRTP